MCRRLSRVTFFEERYILAANLYEALRYFDDTGADRLLAEGTTSEGLGLAIMNRLRKASGFHSIQA